MDKNLTSTRFSPFKLLLAHSQTKNFITILTDLLVELCHVETIPDNRKQNSIASEEMVYSYISETLRKYGLSGELRKHPINPGIKNHQDYTIPYYQEDEDYSGRSNLIHFFRPVDVPSSKGHGIALNAHIDTVAPYFPPYIMNETIFGRGASDDKGCCVAIVGALILLEHLRRETNITPRADIVSMFVTDEESGGNGSLSISLDEDLAKSYDTIMVVESTEGRLFSANRGAVWYRLEICGNKQLQLKYAFMAVQALETCGMRLRNESHHVLFPTKPVQSCHGIIGNYGEHPSRTCGKVDLVIVADEVAVESLQEYVEIGLRQYIDTYGDRTKVIDIESGNPKIDHHYDLIEKGNAFYLTIWGTPGHMGKALENDSAIVKAAWIMETLYKFFSPESIQLKGYNEDCLVLEGGQGFLPTHSIEEVTQRMSVEIQKLTANHQTEFETLGIPVLSFNKLHNDAFTRNPDSEQMKLCLSVAKMLEIKNVEPVVGFPVSCDARIFAHKYPQKQIITIGPGSIAFAHTDFEQISIKDLTQGALQLALNILVLTRTLSIEELRVKAKDFGY